jgi:hypothetical protein
MKQETYYMHLALVSQADKIYQEAENLEILISELEEL